ncbi:MAG TPA: MBL fold metallo-hydrolase [Deltaproteobacteria bacterium]|nr:MBL fold metallo-hydrolase [Deltaproteobacteria bacterium]
MIEVTWTGAAGLIITDDGHTVLIDPYVSRPSKLDVFFTRLQPKKLVIDQFVRNLPGTVDAIIVGHTHFDHTLDVPDIARALKCTVLGSSSLDRLMEISGMSGCTRVCTGGQKVELEGGVSVTMIPSLHGLVVLGRVPYQGEISQEMRLPMRARDYRLGEMFMPKLEIGGITIMHAGSANCRISELDGHSCDVLFMCVPGWKKSREYTTTLLDMLRPEVIVPFHFDDFTAPIRTGGMPPSLPFVYMNRFLEEIRSVMPKTKIRMPLPYSPMRFE